MQQKHAFEVMNWLFFSFCSLCYHCTSRGLKFSIFCTRTKCTKLNPSKITLCNYVSSQKNKIVQIDASTNISIMVFDAKLNITVCEKVKKSVKMDDVVFRTPRICCSFFSPACIYHYIDIYIYIYFFFVVSVKYKFYFTSEHQKLVFS